MPSSRAGTFRINGTLRKAGGAKSSRRGWSNHLLLSDALICLDDGNGQNTFALYRSQVFRSKAVFLKRPYQYIRRHHSILDGDVDSNSTYGSHHVRSIADQ